MSKEAEREKRRVAKHRARALRAYYRRKGDGVCVRQGCSATVPKESGHVYCPVCLPELNAWTKAAKQKARAKGKVAA